MNIDFDTNTINYPHHVVICDTDTYPVGEKETIDYLTDMQETLSADGTADDHVAELESINNDGTWVVKKRI